MTNNEDYIMDRVGKSNPFRVPDGYFDTLASRVMEQLPDESIEAVTVVKPKRSGSWRIVLCAAACLCAAIFGVAVYQADFSVSEANEAQTVASVKHSQSDGSDTYIEEVADYTMMDNSDIYAYLASE